MQKIITKIEHSQNHHMVGDGFRVANYIPGYGREMTSDTSPFLMLDYNAPWQIVPQGTHRPGVGFHPHRGFETVTIVYSGEVEHQDTAGNGGIIGADEVQWMTAGSGLLHNEFMTVDFSRLGGVQHAIQLWINLPKKYKMTTPKYQALTRHSIPEVIFDGGRVRVIAGEFQGVRGIADTFSPIELYDIRFDISHPVGIPLDTVLGDIDNKDPISENKSDSSVSLGMTKETKTLELQIPEEYTTILLVTEGTLVVQGKSITSGGMIHFIRSGTDLTISATGIAKVLIMAGEIIDEPIAHYGPFVMNTQTEIMQAFADLNAGKMGSLDL